MRLTLRTMLCYLDDVLEPADAAELGKKIEDSEYASQVVHRIRTSMRRLRLGAPKLWGEGGNYDPNTVADYLDNTLPPEKVADFERVCLDPESEVQLAEVAACHQILTLVLGEPAEVPTSMRQRIYHLAHPDAIAARGREAEIPQGTNGVAKEEPASVATTAATGEVAAAPPMAAVSEPPKTGEGDLAKRERHKPEIPAYLKEGSRRTWWPALLVLTLAGVAIAGIVYAMYFRPQRPPAVAVVPGEQGDALFTEAESGDEETAGSDTVVAGTDRTKKPVIAKPSADIGETAVADDRAAAASGDDGSVVPTAADLVVPSSVDDTDDHPATESGESVKEQLGDTSVARIDPIGAATPPAGGDEGLPLVDKVIGHYISTGEVIAAFDPKAEAWNRLATRTGVKPGMHLRSLPTYRPQVLLENAVQITLYGDGELIVGNPTTDGTPFLNLPYGKAVLATVSKAGSAVVIRAGERDVLLTFVNADAVVALEVTRFLSVGADPRSELPHVQAKLSVTSGQITWQEPTGDVLTLDAGQQLTMLNDALALVSDMAEPPKWVKLGDISDIDRRASVTLEPLLVDAGPMEVKLEELAQDQRVEVRSLAIRSLASLGRFERILETLNDERLKSYWEQHIEQLQASLGRGAPVAAEVHAAAVRANGADGEILCRLLQGFSPDDLQKDGAKLLVNSLKHSSMEVRVVASNVLRIITGRTQGYHPHLPEARRRTAERQWEQSLAAGEVVYATPPAALPSRKPREMP